MQFEGPEKKFEIIVDPSHPSLRALGRPYWESIVKIAGAEILSVCSNSQIDAYLLSESSLFVMKDRAVMITCGQTRLADAAIEVLKEIPREKVASFIFERKNENFPEKQYSCFEKDVKKLQQWVPGKSYSFGTLGERFVSLFHLDREYCPLEDDQTLEILMHDISEPAKALFSLKSGHSQKTIRSRSGLDCLFPGFEIDDHCFHPEGYSLNAIKDGCYYTIHVTPQAHGSYASFETNFKTDLESLDRTIANILEIFQPRDFDVVSFRKNSEYETLKKSYNICHHSAQHLSCGYHVHYYQCQSPETKSCQKN